MSTLLKSLRKNARGKVIKAAREHLNKAADCVLILDAAFERIKAGKIDEARQKFNALDDVERLADDIRRSILLEITNSEIEETTKEALVHLVRNIDRIANTANGSARIFYQIPTEFFGVITAHDTLFTMLKHTVEAVKKLGKMVDKLLGDGKNIDDINHEIQVLEHEVDKGLARMYEQLMARDDQGAPVPPFVAIQISKGINYIESISDAIEDTADYIKMLTIRKD